MMDQLTKLNALVVAAFDARDVARREDFMCSEAGKRVLLAFHKLTEIDAVYIAAQDIDHELRAPSFNVDQICDERREGL